MMQRVLAHGLSGLYAGWPSPAKLLSPICFVFALLPSARLCEAICPCTGYIDSAGRVDHQDIQRGSRAGVAANYSGNWNPSEVLPSPESRGKSWLCGRSCSGQAPRARMCTESMVIWTRILNENFIDLKPYFTGEISAQFSGHSRQLHRG